MKKNLVFLAISSFIAGCGQHPSATSIPKDIGGNQQGPARYKVIPAEDEKYEIAPGLQAQLDAAVNGSVCISKVGGPSGEGLGIFLCGSRNKLNENNTIFLSLGRRSYFGDGNEGLQYLETESGHLVGHVNIKAVWSGGYYGIRYVTHYKHVLDELCNETYRNACDIDYIDGSFVLEP